MAKDLRTEILSAFFAEGKRVDKLAADDPVRVKGVEIGEMFTSGVAFLANLFPNASIRKLMGLVWNIVGHRITPVALGPEVPSLSLAVMGSKLAAQAIILTPHNWIDMVKADPLLQMGALVYVGSQAVDFYNGKTVEDPKTTVLRSKAFEAEFLLTLNNVIPNLVFDTYQQSVVDEMPLGLSTPSVLPLLYTSKPFVAPS